MSHGCGNVSNPVFGEKFYSIFTWSYRTAVLPPVVEARPKARPCAWLCRFGKPVFKDSVNDLDESSRMIKDTELSVSILRLDDA
ncbi:hypothetical protein GOBAR_AA27451 [Gossypium barbadense]|uniref:Uncharacterized protein n=1 Tax=Gossypium barbadense TaxID=3634 RepID=A0A2P5WQ78_GOSBA|nr:hypothetical protein GOBAR_AA27451 [Gossypium barbadense]